VSTDAPHDPHAEWRGQAWPPMPTEAPPPPRYAPLTRPAVAAMALLGLIVLTNVIAIWSDLLELDLLDRVLAGREVSEAEATNNDDRQALVALIQTGVYLGAIVFFIRWLYRAYKNIDALMPGARRYAHGWAIGGWFVPILSLWRPKQIVNDVWWAGTPEGRRANAWPGLLLVTWWIAFWISNFLGRYASRTGTADDATRQELRDGTMAYLIADSFDCVAALLAILTVLAVTRRMEAKAAATRASVADPWSTPQTP
jgi:hypothetical protein